MSVSCIVFHDSRQYIHLRGKQSMSSLFPQWTHLSNAY